MAVRAATVANCLERRSSPGRDITSPYEKSMTHSARSGAMSLKLSTTAEPVPPVIRPRVCSPSSRRFVGEFTEFPWLLERPQVGKRQAAHPETALKGLGHWHDRHGRMPSPWR